MILFENEVQILRLRSHFVKQISVIKMISSINRFILKKSFKNLLVIVLFKKIF